MTPKQTELREKLAENLSVRRFGQKSIGGVLIHEIKRMERGEYVLFADYVSMQAQLEEALEVIRKMEETTWVVGDCEPEKLKALIRLKAREFLSKVKDGV